MLWWARSLWQTSRRDDIHSSPSIAAERTQPAAVTSAITGGTPVVSAQTAGPQSVERVATPMAASLIPVRPEGGGGSFVSATHQKVDSPALPASIIASLHRKLSRDRIEWAYAELSRPSRQNVLMSHAQDASYKNDLLDKLILQEKLPPDLVRRLIQWNQDQNHDILFRDYCLQFLGSVGERLLREDSKNSDDLRLVNDTLNAALHSTEPSFPGTALLGLERVANAENDAAMKQSVANDAILLASSDATPMASRATAINVAVHYGRTDILPTARRLLTASNDSAVQLACISALGALGNSSDKATLQAIASNPPTPYHAAAAQTALASLSTR